MTPHIVVVGDLVTDIVAVLAAPLAPDSDTPARIRVTGGGQAANTAAWLAWAGDSGRPRGTGGQRGVRVTLVAAAGTDQAGDARVAELSAAGVRCAVVRRAGTPTGAIVVLARGQQRTMITDRGANLTLTGDDVRAALDAAPDAGHLHLSAYTLLDAASRDAGLHALAAARERGLTTSVDAASAMPLRQVGAGTFAEWVRGTDLLLANADEAAVLADGLPPGPAAAVGGEVTSSGVGGEGANALVRVAVVVKRGAAGALWLGADGSSIEASATPVDVVDATGAGDAFAAGLLAAWLSGATPERALRAGTELGALAVSAVGARPGR